MSDQLRRQLKASLTATPAEVPSREDVLIEFMSALKGECLHHVNTAIDLIGIDGEDAKWNHNYHVKRSIVLASALRKDIGKFLVAIGAETPTEAAAAIPVEGGGAILVPEKAE